MSIRMTQTPVLDKRDGDIGPAKRNFAMQELFTNFVEQYFLVIIIGLIK
jgi:hypothetical protein